MPEFGQFGLHAIQHAVDVSWIHDRAIEVGREEFDPERQADGRDALQALEIPSRIITTQLHLQCLESIDTNPLIKGGRVAVGEHVGPRLGEGQEIQPSHEMPRHQLRRDRRAEILRRIASGESHLRGVSRRSEVR